MSRRAAALLAALLAVAGVLGCGGDAGPVSTDAAGDGVGPLAGANLLLITVDGLRADRLGSYGDAAARTPNLDALAASGVRFVDAYTPVPLTLPAHGVLFTGRHPFITGVRLDGVHHLDGAERTLAERFRDAGYATQATVSSYALAAASGLDQGFATYQDDLVTAEAEAVGGEPGGLLSRLSRGPSGPGSNRRPGGVPADRAVDRTLAWLDHLGHVAQDAAGGGDGESGGEGGSDGDSDGNGDSKGDGGRRTGDDAGTDGPPFFAWVHLDAAGGELRSSDAPAEDPYRRRVTFVDAQIGRLLAELSRRGLADDTAVVVTASHGEGFGEHGEVGHGLLAYSETLQVPLIVHAPGPLATSRVVDQRVSLYDVFPTLTGLFGLEPAAVLAGRDLWGVLRPGEPAPLKSTPLYFETLAGQQKGWAPVIGLLDGDYKYIDLPQPELYDLRADPREDHNLLAPETVAVRPGQGTAQRAALPAGARTGAAGGPGTAPGGGDATDAEAAEAERLMTPQERAALLAEARAQARERAEELDRRLAELVRRAPGDARRNRRDLSPEERRRLERLGYATDGETAASDDGTESGGLDPKIGIGLETEMRQARELLRDGRPAQALAYLEAVRGAQPGLRSAELHELSFEAHRALGQPEAALASLRQALATTPNRGDDRSDLKLRLGLYLLELERGPEAAALARELLAEDPESPGALTLLAMVAADREDYAAARRQYRRALALDPGSVELRARVAEMSLRLDDRDRARALYDELLAEGALDGRPRDLARSAMLDAAMGYLERAEETLRQVVRLSPTAAHHYSLGMVLSQRGDETGAVFHLEAALTARGQPLTPELQSRARTTLAGLRGGGGEAAPHGRRREAAAGADR